MKVGVCGMEWVKLAVNIEEDASEMISEILLESGAAGTQMIGGKNPETNGYGEILPAEAAGECRVCAYFPMDEELEGRVARVKERLAGLLEVDLGFDPGTLQVQTESAREEDWENEWKKYFKPQRVSDYIVIKPTWEEYTPENDETVVEIDPGMAFGTGTHETTRMCIALLEEYLQAGDLVLDVGCGSGILSVAAAKLGAGSVLALDLDSVAVETAEKNVALNDTGQTVRVIRSDILSAVSRETRFNIVVANIIADVIVELNQTVLEYMKKPGIYICSGIIRERLDDVLASLKENGLRAIKILNMGEWCAVACKSKG
jgi:ribosomal protein L11 methyltransferase